jgi:hypothetical protein
LKRDAFRMTRHRIFLRRREARVCIKKKGNYGKNSNRRPMPASGLQMSAAEYRRLLQ